MATRKAANAAQNVKPSRQDNSDQWRKQFGLHLRQRASELGLRDAAVARRAGMTPKQYNNYANGERMPAIRDLPRISAALETTVDELLRRLPTLLGRDKGTYIAVGRIHNAILDLLPDDARFLADVAETIKRRRDAELRKNVSPGLSAVWQQLAFAYELLVPSIIRTHLPTELDPHLVRAPDRHVWLALQMSFMQRAEAAELARALVELSRERLGLREEDVKSYSPSTTREGVVEIVLLVRLGPTLSKNKKPSNEG